MGKGDNKLWFYVILLIGGVYLYHGSVPTSVGEGKSILDSLLSSVRSIGSSSNSSASISTPDPVIVAVRPILTGLKIGYFDKDTNSQKYYIITGADITKATLVSADKSYWAIILNVWRVHVNPDSTPAMTWDASGQKVLVVYALLDQTCCSSKALAAN